MSGIGKRVSYYLIGVVLGSFVVYFMFGSRSDIGCDYFPNARVLKNLRIKPLVMSDLANCQKDCLALDSTDVQMLFAAGAVVFDESEPRKKPCGEYKLKVRLPDEREIVGLAQNCDSTVTLLSLVHEGTTCNCN